MKPPARGDGPGVIAGLLLAVAMLVMVPVAFAPRWLPVTSLLI
jgi:hypothetical protein